MPKKKPLTPELQAECAAANELFLAKKNELKLTQKKIADAAGISPAAVTQYLNGTNPLNAKFAATLSRLIDEPVEKFSRRLAAEIASLAQALDTFISNEDRASGNLIAGDVSLIDHAPSSIAAGASGSARAGQAEQERVTAIAALATPRSLEALERIARAANEGRLTEADLILLEQIASRFESSASTATEQAPLANGNQRLKERLRNNDPGTQR